MVTLRLSTDGNPLEFRPESISRMWKARRKRGGANERPFGRGNHGSLEPPLWSRPFVEGPRARRPERRRAAGLARARGAEGSL